MVAFIVKYWIEWLLGIIAAGLGIACKKFYKLYKSEKTHQKTKEQKEFYAGLERLIQEGNDASQAADVKIRKEMSEMKETLSEEIGIVKDGVLSIHGENFKGLCKTLLNPNHTITPEEYSHCINEHDTYNGLGGNHDGDALFKLVVEKATVDISHK